MIHLHYEAVSTGPLRKNLAVAFALIVTCCWCSFMLVLLSVACLLHALVRLGFVQYATQYTTVCIMYNTLAGVFPRGHCAVLCTLSCRRCSRMYEIACRHC
jgi:heme O synthase-like polyprenyltransferase